MLRAAEALSAFVAFVASRQQQLNLAAAAVQLLGMTWRSDLEDDLQLRLNGAAATLLHSILLAVSQPNAISIRHVAFDHKACERVPCPSTAV